MLFSKSGFLAAALLGASTVNAHLYMKSPHPYGQSTLNNSPLEADGSDFPCKQRNGVYAAANGENNFKIGEEQSLTLVGSATHGGGSCQISLSKDLKPTKDSEWMVIKSWEGGCPIKTSGNIGNSPSSVVPGNLKFKIPEGIDNGKYTLAWTWFNRIGNREMYMNCAPITVTGGSSKRSDDEASVQKRSSSFPPMFVANVNGCTTKEDYDIRFPNPGNYVEKLGDAKSLLPEGQSACTGTPKFGAAGIKKGATTSGGSSGSSSGSSTTKAASQATGNAGTFAEGAASSSAPAASSAPASSGSESSGSESSGSESSGSESSGTESSGSSSSSSSSGSSSSSSSSSSSAGAQSGSCSTEGTWNCIGGTSFQRCASGQWTTAQQMAAGTKCTPGQSSELSTSASALKPRMINEMRARRRHAVHHFRA